MAGNACGVAVDPAHNKIYWANFTTSEIQTGNLDGTGTASTLFTDPGGSAPSGVAIDPANNKIYWTNQFSDEVRVGNLNGTGTASTLFSGEDNPIGVAVNAAAGKIYWTDLDAGTVRVGPLGGDTVNPGDEASTLFSTSSGGPSGPSIDPTANKIYWAGWQSGLGIQAGNLNGTGAASPLFSGESSSLFTALLKRPAFERPGISGGPKIGNPLTCQVQFAPDLLGAFLYRAPQTVHYQWKNGPAPVGGDSATFTPTAAGDYTCTVTAANQAGTTEQTSGVKKVKK